MSNFARQQEMREEAKEREKVSRETLGKFFYDLVKLVFAAMAIVGGVALILNEPQVEQAILMGVGICLTVAFSFLGYNVLKR